MNKPPFSWHFGGALLLAACHAEPKTAEQPHQTPAPAALQATTAATSAAALAAFVPTGFGILDSASGDLNRDAWPDKILVLRQDGEDTITDDDLDRPLLLLLGQPSHRYALAARNDHAVLHRNDGGMMGDPYQQTVIKRGFFSLEYYGGSSDRWTRVVTFKYAPADRAWYLSRESNEGFSAFNPDSSTFSSTHTPRDFGKVPFAKYAADSTY